MASDEKKEMTIIDGYIKYRKQFIVLVSGLSGTGKCKIANMLGKDLKLVVLNTNAYFKPKEMIEKITLPNGKVVPKWDSLDAYDWDKLNKDVNDVKEKGVVVCGNYFPSEKLNFRSDTHIHIKLNKQNLLKKRLEYIRKNSQENAKQDIKQALKETTAETTESTGSTENTDTDNKKIPLMASTKFVSNSSNDSDEETETLILNQITLPFYFSIVEKSNINKFFNANELLDAGVSGEEYIEKIYDMVFDKVIDFVQNSLKIMGFEQFIVKPN